MNVLAAVMALKSKEALFNSISFASLDIPLHVTRTHNTITSPHLKTNQIVQKQGPRVPTRCPRSVSLMFLYEHNKHE